MKLIQTKINYKGAILVGDKLENPRGSKIVLLHGGGLSASRKRFNKIRNELFVKGYSTFSFDFIGHGETLGDILESNLISRTKQAEEFINAHLLKEDF